MKRPSPNIPLHVSLGNLSLKQLRAFVYVAQSSSFTAAAAMLSLTQSAVSQLIRELESELGLRLLDRTTRSVRLTEAGAELQPVAARVLQDLGAAVAGSRELANRRRGRVRLACTPLQSYLLLPRAIRAFGERYPDITVILRDTPGGDIVKLVTDGEVDLGLAIPPADDTFVTGEPLFVDDLLLIHPRSYGWAPARRVGWKDLSDLPYIALGETNTTRYLVDHHAKRAGVTLDKRYEVAFAWTAIALVEAGLGFSLIPGYARPVVRHHPQVEMRAFDRRNIRRPVQLLHQRSRTLSPAAQTFAAFLHEFVAQES